MDKLTSRERLTRSRATVHEYCNPRGLPQRYDSFMPGARVKGGDHDPLDAWRSIVGLVQELTDRLTDAEPDGRPAGSPGGALRTETVADVLLQEWKHGREHVEAIRA